MPAFGSYHPEHIHEAIYFHVPTLNQFTILTEEFLNKKSWAGMGRCKELAKGLILFQYQTIHLEDSLKTVFEEISMPFPSADVRITWPLRYDERQALADVGQTIKRTLRRLPDNLERQEG